MITVRIRGTIIGVAVSSLAFATAPASASCVSSTPPPSTSAFTGVVTETRLGGRLAVVRADDGRLVEVRGGHMRVDMITSVDRTYAAGGRYEFHPINATTPYQDNACTATRLIEVVGMGEGATGSAGNDGATSAFDTSAGTPYLAGAALGGVGLVFLLGVALFVRRRGPGRVVIPDRT